MGSYARDPIGETSACSSLLSLVYGVRNENLGCSEVFPSGGTAWEDDKKSTHINLTKEI
jgi:hypothetical protein